MSDDGYVRAVKLEDLPQGSKQVFEINGKPILVCHTGGKIFAVSNICSHAEEKLDCGRMGPGWIACPIHGARFDLATGKAKNPPAKQPIPVYKVQITDGWVEVEA